MPSFSERQGYFQPKEISFRDELPVELRIPIFDILRRAVRSAFLWERIEKLFSPYGTDDLPQSSGPIAISREEDTPDLISDKRVLLNCPWFRVYDIIEDIFDRLDFHDRELRTDPEEEAMAFPYQRDINDYFKHVGRSEERRVGKECRSR